MNDEMLDEPDDLNDVLGGDAADRSGALRAIVLARTTRVLRRRRLVKRSLFVAMLVGCYLAGALTMRFAGRASPPSLENLVQQSPAVPVSVTPAEAPVQARHVPPPQSSVSLTRFETLRHAGDLQLQQKGDLLAAVRFYKRALDVASEDELAISVDNDNWLLMSLKEARLQEVHHARNDG